MNRFPSRLFRASMMLYPGSFRRAYGNEMVQLMEDRDRQGDVPSWRLTLHAMSNVALTAPLMRWESPMTRITLIVVAAALGLFGTLASSPIVLLPLVAIGVVLLLVAFGRRQEHPLAPTDWAQRWYLLLVPGIVSLAVGLVVLLRANGELSAWGWTTWFFSWAAGFVLTGLSLVMAIMSRQQRPTPPPPKSATFNA